VPARSLKARSGMLSFRFMEPMEERLPSKRDVLWRSRLDNQRVALISAVVPRTPGAMRVAAASPGLRKGRRDDRSFG